MVKIKMKKQEAIERINQAIEVVWETFYWDTTEEGIDFWSKVYHSLIAIKEEIIKNRKFRRKVVDVEAIQWNGRNKVEIFIFGGEHIRNDSDDSRIAIATKEGILYAQKGDWIVKGIEGEIYPVSYSVFNKLYEEI